tara:strand:- start:657 stop:1025 length:369 start_codon:yes stop_codon:yes gene_type:complete
MAPSVKKRKLYPKSLWDEDELLETFEQHGINKNHLYRMWRYFIQNGVKHVRDVPEMPKKAVALLEKDYTLTTVKVRIIIRIVSRSTIFLIIAVVACRMNRTEGCVVIVKTICSENRNINIGL